MATENNTPKPAPGGRTDLLALAKHCHPFYEIPACGSAALFYVPAHLQPDLAEAAGRVAGAIESAVQDQLQLSVTDGLDGNSCFLFSFALEAARALRDAVDSSRHLELQRDGVDA
jgi:hypothetical protein